MREPGSHDGLGTISRKQGLVVGIAAAGIFGVSVAFGSEPIGTALALSFLVICCVTIICWPLRDGQAFFPYLALISGVHAVASFTLASGVGGKLTYVLVPFIFVDIFVNVYALKWIIGRSSSG